MVEPATPASEFADALAAEIRHNYPAGRVTVAVDGVAGTGPFAAELVRAFRRAATPPVAGLSAVGDVFGARMDDFQRPREARELREADPGAGWYFDRFDVPLLQRVLLDPFRFGGSAGFQLAGFDAARDVPFESRWSTAGPDAVLVVDGPFLQRPGLRGRFLHTVYLEGVWFGVPEVMREADALYQAEAGPRFGATSIVDVGDPAHPRRVFADSC